MNAELLHYGESVFTAGREFTERTPSYWTIEYIITGRARIIVDRTASAILPGHLAVIPPGAERRKRYTRGTRSVWFHAVLMPPAGEALIRVAPHDEIGHLVEACRLLIAKRETASLEAVLAALLTAVNARAPMTDARLLPVLSYIHANMHRPMRIPALAELAGVSRYHFMEIFRKKIGRPVMQYVGEVRASHAASLIACGAAIRRAAARVGFSDEKAFSRSFKRWIGVSPAEYRRRRILPAITVPRSDAVFQSWRMNDGTPAENFPCPHRRDLCERVQADGCRDAGAQPHVQPVAASVRAHGGGHAFLNPRSATFSPVSVIDRLTLTSYT